MWKGIDVSNNQGVIEWGRVKADGCQFAILRSIRRSGKADYQFVSNLIGCRLQKIPVSVYKYTYALSPDAAAEEARQVIELLRAHALSCTVWWDVEDKTVHRIGSDELTACIKAAQTVVEAAGQKFGLYAGLNVYREKWFDFDVFSTCPLWAARYPTKKVKTLNDEPDDIYMPDMGRSIWGWQHSSTGKVDGITGNVDLDVCYVDPADVPVQEQPGQVIIYTVSVADVWTRKQAQQIASTISGAVVHRVKVLA